MHKLFIFFCLIINLSAYAGTKKTAVPVISKPKPQLLHIDSSKIIKRAFKKEELNQYRENPEFNYHTDITAKSTWWDRFWMWIWNILENLFGKSSNQKQSAPVMGRLLLAVGAITLAYFIIKGLGLTNIFLRKAEQVPLAHSEWNEDINQISFDDEIEKAIALHNFRFAVRLLYLRCLKQLNDAHLIQWEIEKTNATYLNELTNAEQKKQFGMLTLQFEYSWYGNFPVDSKSFQNIHALFNDFKKIMQ